MTYQTSKGLHSDLKKYGCYFLSILRIYEKEALLELEVETVNKIYKLCQKMDYVGHDAYIMEGGISGIAQIASAVTTASVYMRLMDNQGNYNNIIGKFSRELPSGLHNSHFVLMENANDVAYDPWPNSKTVREGQIVDYRYIHSEVL